MTVLNWMGVAAPYMLSIFGIILAINVIYYTKHDRRESVTPGLSVCAFIFSLAVRTGVAEVSIQDALSVLSSASCVEWRVLDIIFSVTIISGLFDKRARLKNEQHMSVHGVPGIVRAPRHVELNIKPPFQIHIK